MRLADLKPGLIVNKRYRVLGIVGRGGMGTVVRATRLHDNTVVAIKFCHAEDDDGLRRFAREVRLMRQIEHRHVVPILGIGLKHTPPYFVMPFADGSCASQLATFVGDETVAINAFMQICEGVRAIHAAGGVHRDIKPDNALVFGDCIALADLGLAKLTDRDTTILTQTRAIVGTDMYLAPEQRFPGGSRDADQRTDIYQLGKTLYQLLTGLEPALVDLGRVPAGLAHVVRRATREQPDERYQSVGQMMDAVRAYLRAKDPMANPRNAFETALNGVTERLDREEYRADEVQSLLEILATEAVQHDGEQFLELIDSVPITILAVMVEAFPAEFQPVLEHYVQVIDDTVAGRSFTYAETVATRMKAVCVAATSAPIIRGLAIEATLVAAVRLNRFAAMDTLREMLVSTQDDPSAAAVYDALDRRRTEYSTVCEQVPSLKLHPQIRALRDELARAKDG